MYKRQIENLKEHMHEIKGKMGEKIRENIDIGLQSKKIATILRDVPVSYTHLVGIFKSQLSTLLFCIYLI